MLSAIKGYLGFGVIILLLGGIIYWQNSKINTLNREVAEVNTARQYELKIYNEEREKALKVITDQNAQITKFALDKESYEKTILTRERELAANQSALQTKIATELSKDNSCDNQLRLVSNQLLEFGK